MFSSIRLLVLISSFAATILSTAATNDETAAASVETILGDMNIAISTTRLMNRASPKCWMASITMSQWGSVSGSVSGASYCASMTTEQQKVLALELTNCQLMEENRSLFVQDQDNGSTQVSKHATCHVGKGGFEPYEVSSCLPFMSDFALNLYHQVLLYTNDVCNRLTYDAMEQQKEETTIMLIKASSSFIDLTRQQQTEADLSQKAREQAMEEAVSRNKLYLQEHQQQWEEVNQARQMEVERVQEARERAAEAREREVEAREKAALLSMEEMVEQNKMHFQEQQQKWEELSSARDTEMLIVEERREQTEAIIKKQQYDMERMQEVIANTNSQMQPLSSMHLYVKMVTSGFTVLKSILIFFFSMNVSWMITTVPLLTRARRSMYGVFFVGFVVELAVVCLAEDTSLADDGVNVVELIRIYTRVSALIVCVISFFVTCIFPKKEATSNDTTMDELLKRQMEIVAMLGAAQQMESNVSTPMMKSPHIVHSTMEQPQCSVNREEARDDSFIVSNPNFKPSRRQRKSSHYQPYHKPMRVCASPVLNSKKSAAAEPMKEMVNTVTPNTRFRTQHEYYDDRAIVSGHEMQHTHKLRSNAESSSDSTDDSSDEDAPAQLVMTKKKRKHAELQTSESEQQCDSPRKHQSKVDETKKKKPKLEEIKIY